MGVRLTSTGLVLGPVVFFPLLKNLFDCVES